MIAAAWMRVPVVAAWPFVPPATAGRHLTDPTPSGLVVAGVWTAPTVPPVGGRDAARVPAPVFAPRREPTPSVARIAFRTADGGAT